jgi:hypothetical protein
MVEVFAPETGKRHWSYADKKKIDEIPPHLAAASSQDKAANNANNN